MTRSAHKTFMPPDGGDWGIHSLAGCCAPPPQIIISKHGTLKIVLRSFYKSLTISNTRTIKDILGV